MDHLRMTRPRFNRILLKLSGEVLMGSSQFGIDPETVDRIAGEIGAAKERSEEHTSELQSLMRISYDVFCLKKKKNITQDKPTHKTAIDRSSLLRYID